MADLTITKADVGVAKSVEQYTAPASEAIDAGEAVIFNASGEFALARATTATLGKVVGIAANSVNAGEALTVIKRGIIDLGSALSGVAMTTTITLSDTLGKLDNGAGSPTADYNVGIVGPAWGTTSVDKLLYVDISVA